MQRLIVVLAGALACIQAAAQVFEAPKVVQWRIPEGKVARIEVDGEVIWPSIPYATNGLIAYWDGVWNAGLGVHDPSATVWKDLSGSGFDATQRVAAGWSWGTDAYVGTATNGHGFKLHYAFTQLLNSCGTNHTIEIVSSVATQREMVVFSGYTPYRLHFQYYYQEGMRFRWFYNRTPDMWVYAPTSRATFSVRATPTQTYGYINGEQVVSAAANGYSKPDSTDCIIIGGEFTRPHTSMGGEICAIRVYGRVLSPAEIANHAAIDAIRFGFANQLIESAVASWMAAHGY